METARLLLTLSWTLIDASHELLRRDRLDEERKAAAHNFADSCDGNLPSEESSWNMADEVVRRRVSEDVIPES